MVQDSFVSGIHGSVDSEDWRHQPSQLGLNDVQQNNVMKDCMKASIEDMHSVLRTRPLEKKLDGSNQQSGNRL